MFKGIDRWQLILMFVLMGAMLVAELVAVFSPRMATMTQIIKALIPIPLRVIILAWLNWHFFGSDIVRQLIPKP